MLHKQKYLENGTHSRPLPSCSTSDLHRLTVAYIRNRQVPFSSSSFAIRRTNSATHEPFFLCQSVLFIARQACELKNFRVKLQNRHRRIAMYEPHLLRVLLRMRKPRPCRVA